MNSENVKLQEDFKQVCVWPACVVGKGREDGFIKFMLEEFKARVQYLEEIKTTLDTNQSRLVEGTGGRNDLFFAVHNEDVGKFAVPRLSVGIRWIEDVLAKCNYDPRIYPERVFHYCCWNEEFLEEKEK